MVPGTVPESAWKYMTGRRIWLKPSLAGELSPWGKHPGDTKSLNLQSTAPEAVLLPCAHCQELHLLRVDLSQFCYLCGLLSLS